MPQRLPGCVRTLGRCILLVSVLSSCTGRSFPTPDTTPRPQSPGMTPVPVIRIQYGLASWYGRERQGRRTANGERFDSSQLTAAHRTAPFGSYALVTNLTNGLTVRVRINDRGPALPSRVLDLSYAAAHQLDMVRTGVARVRVEFLAAGLSTHETFPPRAPDALL